ncbi:MAG: hypothetical protein FJW85_09150 [Actinobacteria bacterium]|nr:hypothetical protein [Actinomycetota bacterium]
MSGRGHRVPEVEASLAAHLGEVIARGAPAQRDEARRLVRVLREDPTDAAALADAARLVDAYLHDPYLEPS